MNRFIRRVLLCWIVLTVMLLVLWVKAHAQSPYFESHSKIVNRRLSPPSLVKVGEDTYCIVLVPRFAEPKLLGLTSNEKKKIWILKGQALADEKEDVVHELLHAALKTQHSDDIQTMHDFIYDSAGSVVDMLHDNPQLVRYLTQ